MSVEKNEPLSFKETQLAALQVLKRVDEICRKQGFRYFIAYGTLIGAVRHHGFIPWDDDVDVQMPRPDFDKFVEYFRNNADELAPLCLVQCTAERGVPFLIARVSDTTYQMQGEFSWDVPELGVFVDVYPLDGIGDSLKEASETLDQAHRNMLSYIRAGNFSSRTVGNGALKKIAKKILSVLYGDSSKWFELIEENARSRPFEESEYVGNAVWTSVYNAPAFPRRCYDESVTLEFEGFNVCAPAGYDELLRIHFGDYMALPPEEERVPGHKYQIFRRQNGMNS